jgi:dihydropteroate synthase
MNEWHLPDRVLRFDDRPLIMGIVNVTPDSFSDGGRFAGADAAVAHGLRLIEDGADILDIGGESTRPGSQPVPGEEELRRVLPVVERLAGQVGVPLSVDTSKALVAQRCLEAGAKIVNDVTALGGDPDMAQVVRDSRAGVILMHMQGTPATMQIDPVYPEVISDIRRFFQQRIDEAVSPGVNLEQIVLDPGVGFGKTVEHNLEILARLEEFQSLGRPICLGVSRKGFAGKILSRPVEERLAGSLAAACHALSKRAVQILRVHDVRETRDAVLMFRAIEGRRSGR